jgi:hypothetical protein
VLHDAKYHPSKTLKTFCFVSDFSAKFLNNFHPFIPRAEQGISTKSRALHQRTQNPNATPNAHYYFNKANAAHPRPQPHNTPAHHDS